MLTRAIAFKPLLLVGVLLTTFVFCKSNLGQNRDLKPSQKPDPNEARSERALPSKDRSQERLDLAQSIVRSIHTDTKSVLNPVIRIRIRMLLADAYWSFQPEKAREILSEDFPKISLIAVPKEEGEFGSTWSPKNGEKPETYKGVPLEQVKKQLRREMLAITSSHDPALARALVAAENTKDQKDDATAEERDEVLATVRELADTDPDAAARILRESLQKPPSDAVAFLLIRLRETSPAEASAIFNQWFLAVKAKGDLWELERLVPFILPTELDRLIGGKQYLTDPQRMKDAKSVVEYSAELLYHRIQTHLPSQIGPDLVRREYYLWRNLQGLFSDLQPESVWLVNTRLRQLSEALPQSARGQTQSQWSEERLKNLIAQADASTGDRRDEYLSSAAFNAWRVGQGDLDQAIVLAEKIGQREMRDLTLGTLYFQAGLKFLRTEGPDYALNLARKIDAPGTRTRLYLAIIRSLNSVKASQRTDALRDELLNWLRNRDKTSETAWALLDYLDASTNDTADRNFLALDLVVRVLNSPTLDPETKLRNKTYWHPDFHDFRKSLMPLAKADFDKGLEIVQMLSNREIAMQIQAALCSDYLKTRRKAKRAN